MNNGQKILLKLSVIVQLKDLIHVIKQDQTNRVKTEESLTINIFNATNKTDQSTTGLNGNFVHSLLEGVERVLRARVN